MPDALSWYPAIQTHTEESAPVIVQIAPLPQLHSLIAVVVDGILVDVKALLEIWKNYYRSCEIYTRKTLL